jgi:hypothetical protein
MALSLLGSATRSVPPVAERNFEQRVSPSPAGDRTDRACNPRKLHLGALQASSHAENSHVENGANEQARREH